MVRIHHVTLTRPQLDAIPETERRLLVLMAHASNELSILSKLFHFSARSSAKNPILMQAENAQALVLGRVLTGKIYECWNLLQSAFFGTALSKAYVPQFDEEASQALDEVKRYFGRGNLIETVRNKHAFHYAPDQIDAGYRALVDGDPLEVYLSDSNANTLYAFADAIAGRAMLEGIKPADARRAFEMLVDDTARMVGRLNIIIGQILAISFRTHLGGDLEELGARLVNIEGAPNSQAVSIPYFVEINGDVDVSGRGDR